VSLVFLVVHPSTGIASLMIIVKGRNLNVLMLLLNLIEKIFYF